MFCSVQVLSRFSADQGANLNVLPVHILAAHAKPVLHIQWQILQQARVLYHMCVPAGADDKLCKVWDYQTKACVQTLEGHSHNVSAVCFHPELPIIITGSEDGTVKIWHNTTYRMENTLSYGMERVWAVGYVRGSNNVAVGFDEGCVVIKMGSEEPVASMDASGKIIYARHNEIQTAAIKALGGMFSLCALSR